MEKVTVKIKNKRRNSNWHDINKVLIQLPAETIGVLALAIIEAHLLFRTLHKFSLAFNFNDTIPCIHFFPCEFTLSQENTSVFYLWI